MITELTLGAIALGVLGAIKNKNRAVSGIGVIPGIITSGTCYLVIERWFANRKLQQALYYVCDDKNAAKKLLESRANIAYGSGYKKRIAESAYDFEMQAQYPSDSVVFHAEVMPVYCISGTDFVDPF